MSDRSGNPPGRYRSQGSTRRWADPMVVGDHVDTIQAARAYLEEVGEHPANPETAALIRALVARCADAEKAAAGMSADVTYFATRCDALKRERDDAINGRDDLPMAHVILAKLKAAEARCDALERDNATLRETLERIEWQARASAEHPANHIAASWVRARARSGLDQVAAEGGTARQGTATAETVGSSASGASPHDEVGGDIQARCDALENARENARAHLPDPASVPQWGLDDYKLAVRNARVALAATDTTPADRQRAELDDLFPLPPAGERQET